MHIQKEIPSSKVWATFYFPYRIGLQIDQGLLMWQPCHTSALKSNLNPENDIFGVVDKISKFGELVRGSSLPVERIDIAYKSGDSMDIRLKNGYEYTEEFLTEINRLVKQAFCLEIR
jgi:hypothetical protein